MPGLGRGRRARLALRLPLAEHNDRPVPRPGHDVADQPARDRATHDVWACYRAERARARRCAPSSGSTTGSTTRSPTRTPTSSPASRPGMATTGWRPGPLGEREAAVAWFADHVRRDAGGAPGDGAGAGAGGRARAHPGRCLRRDRRARHRGRPDRPDRDRSPASRPPLVHYHFATREALLAEALEHSFELLGDFRTTAADDEGWTARAAPRLDDRPVAPVPRHGRPRVAAVARAVGPRGAPARAAPGRGAAVRALRRVDRTRWWRTASRRASSARRTPQAVVQRLVAAIDGVGLRVLVDDPAMAAAARAPARSSSSSPPSSASTGGVRPEGDVMQDGRDRPPRVPAGRRGVAGRRCWSRRAAASGRRARRGGRVRRSCRPKIDGDLLIFNWTEYMNPKVIRKFAKLYERQGHGPTSTRCRA